jgi:hypothetical protein
MVPMPTPLLVIEIELWRMMGLYKLLLFLLRRRVEDGVMAMEREG